MSNLQKWLPSGGHFCITLCALRPRYASYCFASCLGLSWFYDGLFDYTMWTPFPLPRLALHFVAILFALCAVTFSILWIYQIKYSTPRPGLTSYEYSPVTHAISIGEVLPGSPADRAGLHPGDRIVAIDGQNLDDLRPFYRAFFAVPKQVVELTVESSRPPASPRQVSLQVNGGRHVPRRTLQWRDLLALPIDYYPLGFLVVGIAVLLLRPDDRNAWLLALLFGGFAAVAPMFEGNIPPPLRGFSVCYKIIMSWSSLALFYYFFAVFPSSSPIDRKVPWLKYLLLGAALFTTVPIGLRCLVAGGTLPLYTGFHWPGSRVVAWVLSGQTGLPTQFARGWPTPGSLFFAFFFAAMALGLASLVSNNLLAPDPQVRRKAHVMVWGTVIGVTPVCLVTAAAFTGVVRVPIAVWQVVVLFLSFVWPLSFAYAVVKHRVLELPVLLKRSARYLFVQRGFTVLLLVVWIVAVRFFVYVLSKVLGAFSDAALVLGLVLGVVLVWLFAPAVKRVTERIDRAFFRSAHDARQILESLVEETRTVTTREELAVLLGGQIKQALHPAFASVYLADHDSQLRVFPELSSKKAPPLSPSLPLLRELTLRNQPWQISDFDSHDTVLPDDLAIFGSHHAQCLVPILGRSGDLTGLLVLGARLSEESYSREDKRLLSAVASQAGGTLENMRLAEEMAERLEAERRMARDMEIAKQVQARLFPQRLPALTTLEYAGRCIQAREVGGDYYDFLNLGAGRLGIVLADIVGKGIPGALLMANLQADVRSQCAIAAQDLPQFLKSVNQVFFESTDEGRYATLFFGDYHDSTRRLRFGNCGHNPPLLVHPNGVAERLTATATVLGLFEQWESCLAEVQLAAGDVLVVYTDGVTEADNSNGEEFGEKRLLETIRRHLTLPVPSILDAIVHGALDFTGGEGKMRDDLTLVVARVR